MNISTCTANAKVFAIAPRPSSSPNSYPGLTLTLSPQLSPSICVHTSGGCWDKVSFVFKERHVQVGSAVGSVYSSRVNKFRRIPLVIKISTYVHM